MKTRDEDFVSDLFVASTHSYILIFTNRGRIYWLKVHELPEVGPNARGKAIVNLLPVDASSNAPVYDERLSRDVRRFAGGEKRDGQR